MHVRARAFYEGCVARGDRFLPTNYVTDETATRLPYDAGLCAAQSFRGALIRSVEERRLRIAWIDPRLEGE
jgi:hypothetical protein